MVYHAYINIYNFMMVGVILPLRYEIASILEVYESVGSGVATDSILFVGSKFIVAGFNQIF